MRAVDTNVLVRLLARDDTTQAGAADDAIAKGAWVSHLVLAEAFWVLDAWWKAKSEPLDRNPCSLHSKHTISRLRKIYPASRNPSAVRQLRLLALIR